MGEAELHNTKAVILTKFRECNGRFIVFWVERNWKKNAQTEETSKLTNSSHLFLPQELFVILLMLPHLFYIEEVCVSNVVNT